MFLTVLGNVFHIYKWGFTAWLSDAGCLNIDVGCMYYSRHFSGAMYSFLLTGMYFTILTFIIISFIPDIFQVIFSQSSELLERQSSMASSTECVSG